MSIDLVFRIAAVGILLAVLNQVLKGAGREDMATLATLTGLVIVLVMVIDLVAQLFDSVKALFQLY